MRKGGALALALAALCLGASPARPQAAPRARFEAGDSVRPRLAAPVAGLLSATVPGAGEYVLGLDRWVPRLAVEAFAWWEYRAHRREARGFEVRYRQLACQVARRIDAAALVNPGVCRDSSDFEYYETMGKPDWSRSGEFDSDPLAPGVQPESDGSTYNGGIWVQAQRLFGARDQAQALAYYERRAIHPGYRWDWGDNRLEQTVYDELIHRSDAAFRTSSRILGLILANHVTSAVDVYIAARLREMARAQRVEVRTGFEPGVTTLRWQADVRIVTGRR